MRTTRVPPESRAAGSSGGFASFLAFVALVAGLPAPAFAQQDVRGTVLDGGSGEPVAGVMVVLIASDGRFVGRALSSADGGFRLTVREPGRYRLRIDRIGYARTVTAPFDVVEGESVRLDVTTTVRPVELAGLEAEGARRCQVRPAEGLATARVWEEARKALAAAEWTAERELYRFSWTRYERDVAEDGRRILDERRTSRNGVTRQPFKAVDATSLARDGFVRSGDDVDVYRAPDASVLLSDVFLDTHCLALDRGPDDDPSLIGLRFEPVPGRDLPEVAGVLWLEEDGGRLRSLEYRYVNLDTPAGGNEAGGEITFRDLPDGTWIVQDWRIRMPKLAAERDRYGDLVNYRAIGFRDEGGVVEEVRTAGGDPVPGGLTGGVLRGTVVDSLGEPVQGATVRVVGTSSETATASEGTFRFPDLGRRTWIVEASHPTLVAVGHTATGAAVEMAREDVRDVRLELPSVRDVVMDRCEGEPPGEREAALVGRVLDPEGSPVAGADVRALWTLRSTVAFQRVLTRERGAGVETEEDGTYVVCPVPTDHVVGVTASTGEEASDTVEVRVPRDAEVVAADLRLRPVPVVVDMSPEGAVASVGGEPETDAPPTPLPPADSLWLASRGFWLRGEDALLHYTSREIAARSRDATMRAVVARAPGVEAVLGAGGRRHLRMHAAGAVGADEGCEPGLYLNGRRVRQRDPWIVAWEPDPPRGVTRRARASRTVTALSLDELIVPAALTGIEVHGAARAPVGDPEGCGAVLLWSRAMALADDPDFTGTVEGRVVCASDGRAIAAAGVRLEPGGVELVTDDEGRFSRGGLLPARYRVAVDVPEWGTWATAVQLRSGADAHLTVDVEGCGG